MNSSALKSLFFILPPTVHNLLPLLFNDKLPISQSPNVLLQRSLDTVLLHVYQYKMTCEFFTNDTIENNTKIVLLFLVYILFMGQNNY